MGRGGRWRELVRVREDLPAPGRLLLGFVGAGVALLVVLRLTVPAPAGILLLGAVFGSLYGLIGAGLVLIYRTNRIVNFAQGDLGALPALLAFLLMVGSGWNFWIALGVGLATAAVLGAGTERLVIRRFSKAPRLILTVATIGIAQILAGLQLLLPRAWDIDILPSVPTPFDFSFRFGDVFFSGNHVLTLLTVPLAMAALAAFFRLTRVGIAARATAENSERACMLGIPVHRIATLVWVLAALLSALAAILRASIVGVPLGTILGPALLLRALAPAVVARMENLPLTFATAVGIGVIEQAVFYNTGRTVETDVVVFVVILGALLLQRRRATSRSEAAEMSTWTATQQVRPVPRELAGLPEVRYGTVALAGLLGLVLLAYPLVAPGSHVNLLSVIVIFTIVAASLLILTGWAGQISLGHMAFVGFGAAVAGSIVQKAGIHWLPALAAGALAGALVAVAVGLPALRIRGLFLAVTTLAFALTSASYFLSRDHFAWMLPTGEVPRPGAGRFDLESERSFYFVVLAFAVLVFLSIRTLRRTRTGRALIAARDNEHAAQSFGINLTTARLAAFALSGFFAAFAGGLFVLHQRDFATTSFRPEDSLAVFSMVVIGGLGSLPGTLLGSAYYWSAVFFLPGSWTLLSTGAGMLLLLLVIPGGLGQLLYTIRDALLRRVAARHDIAVPSLVADRAPERGPPVDTPHGDGLLVCRDVDVSYGRVQVLFGVSLEVGEGEIVALLGTNGAGKSTLLKAIAGAIPFDGDVTVDGEPVAGRRADQMTADGVVLVPGGRGVFAGLTVAENLTLAAWTRRDPEVKQSIEDVGVRFPILRERFDDRAGNLSGGEQQMLTLAQAFIARPKLLMIDELSLGLAPALVGRLLDAVREIHASGTTVVIVEQSVNVALSLAERAYFMEKGEIRFAGPTTELLQRPDVVRSVFLEGAAVAMGASDGKRPRRRRKALPEVPAVLEVDGLTKRYGGVVACDDVSFTLGEGRILGLIGPNGAGKTTVFDLLSGFMEPEAGRVHFFGHDITGWPPHRRALAGLGRSFQDARLFGGLTVRECIAVALERHAEVRDTVLAAIGHPDVGDSERRISTRTDELVDLMGLGAYRDRFAGELSTGTRRIVDLACALAHQPKVLILDEPSSGIAQRETEALEPLLLRVKEELGCSLLVIEHDIPLITSLADEMIALDLGRIVARGTPAEVTEHPAVVASYLGSDDAAIFRSGKTPRKRTRRRASTAQRNL